MRASCKAKNLREIAICALLAIVVLINSIIFRRLSAYNQKS